MRGEAIGITADRIKAHRSPERLSPPPGHVAEVHGDMSMVIPVANGRDAERQLPDLSKTLRAGADRLSASNV